MDIRIYDIENLPLGTRVTLVTCDGLKYPAVVFGNRFGFGNGNLQRKKYGCISGLEIRVSFGE